MPIHVNSRLKPDMLLPAYVTAAEHGIKGALQSGELGYPVINVQATIVKGEYDARENRWDADPQVSHAYIHFVDGTGAHFCSQGACWYTFSLVGTIGLAMAYDNNNIFANSCSSFKHFQ